MITLPETLQNAVVNFGLSTHFEPDDLPRSTSTVTVNDSQGRIVGRKSFTNLSKDTASVISFIEDCVREYAKETAA